ncbi:MAG: phosphomannose isomerase type II C-terminal cupin domain [Candidatus Marinimicrobia bacterium]|nr:phosphomannose isomerase type II C-terminal cupin domain [Candidatus Neomarinimicrobiota bacterium]
MEKDTRPWGNYYVISHEKNYKLKKIEVNPGQKLSYQYHNKRSETWVIISGTATVTINGKVKDYREGETVIIPLKSKHRVENKESRKLVFIEIQTGTYFGEDDIIRIEDKYGRE